MEKKEQGDSEEELPPLHKRRFEAKSGQSPNALNSLPDNNKEESRRFCEEVVEKYGSIAIPELQNLSERSAATASAALATQDAFDHLDKLYILMDQLLTLKEQTSKMQRKVRDIEHLKSLQEIHKQIEKEMQKASSAECEDILKDEATSMDLGEEYGYTEALLDSMLAAGRNASLKRAKWKSPSRTKFRQSLVRKQRSRSMGGDELEIQFPEDLEINRNVNVKNDDDKSKISKWTRVKAAFKWEKAHTGVSNEPIPGPSGVSSTFTSTTPGSLSSCSSSEDVRNGGHAEKHEIARRSRSLDSSVVLDSGPGPNEDDVSSPGMGKMHKSPWGKMKDIIQTRKESVRKKQNRSSIKSISDGRTSENYSLSDSAEILGLGLGLGPIKSSQEKSESSLQDMSEMAKRTTPTLTVTMPSSEELPKPQDSPRNRRRELRKQKSLDLAKKHGKFNLDSSDPDTASSPVVNRRDSKWKKVKKAFLTSTSMSTPSSPCRHTAFFPEYDQEISEDSGSKCGFGIEDEIRKDYAALQSRLSREFTERAQAWGSGSQSPGPSSLLGDWSGDRGKMGEKASGPLTPGSSPVSDTRFSSNFRKKSQLSTRGPPPLLSHAQLSDDFRKKLEEWKRLKATNSVPSYMGDDSMKDHDEKHNKHKKSVSPQKKEVLVQTGAGFFRFEGISRSFTRKLHEWEKSRGIAPEASTSALLKESLAKPPRPATRPTGRDLERRIKNDRTRLQRSQSEGSVREEPASMIAATSASSLSLSKFEENPPIFQDDICDLDSSRVLDEVAESDSDECPGALLVEVEDVEEETAAPLVACTPMLVPQTPIYKYGQAQERHRACESNEGKLSPISQPVLPDSWQNQICIVKESLINILKEEETVQKLLRGLRNIADRCDDVLKQIEELKAQSTKSNNSISDMEKRVGRLSKEKIILQNSLRDRLKNTNDLFPGFIQLIRKFKISGKDCSEEIQRLTVKLYSKTKSCIKQSSNRVKLISEGKLSGENILSDLNRLLELVEEIKTTCDGVEAKRRNSNLGIMYKMSKGNSTSEKDESKESSDVKEVSPNPTVKSQQEDERKTQHHDSRRKFKENGNRSLTSSMRKKTKTKRLERDKSLHSDSDTENESNTITVELPRRKKSCRSRRTSETHLSGQLLKQNSLEKSNTDSGDNIFILKLKPNNAQSDSSTSNLTKEQDYEVKQTIVMKKKSFDRSTQNSLEKEDSIEILISPEQLSIDLPPEGIEIQAAQNMGTSTPDVFVKTTRKIFSPIRRDSKGKTKAVIGLNIEDIANSIERSKIERNSSIGQSQENLPDVIVNKNKDVENEAKDERASNRSHTSSPLYIKKFNHSAKTLTESHHASEESINNYPIRRGSSDKFFYKGSPILSRSSTPNVSISALPPLPASPPSVRRDKPLAKEASPSIRIMIQKYNKRLNEEGGENKIQSGGTTPPWRSPRSQERFPHDVHHILHHSPVRNNPFFTREVQKSASASQIIRKNSIQESICTKRLNNSKENVSDTNSEMTPPQPKKFLKGILKSSSAGSLKANSPLLLKKTFVEEKNIHNVINKSEQKENDVPPNNKKDTYGKYSKKISTELLKQAISMPNTPIETLSSDPFREESPVSSDSRASKLKKAKEQFLAFNSRDLVRQRNCDLAANRLSQISCGSDTSYEGHCLVVDNSNSNNNSNNHLTKSASVGMINENRNRSNRDKGYESLPRNQSNLSDDTKSASTSKSGSRFGLASLASKFRKVRMRKPKKEDKLNTISRLCRQSLSINIENDNFGSGSQTDTSIVSAGKTGAAVAAGSGILKSESSSKCEQKNDKK